MPELPRWWNNFWGHNLDRKSRYCKQYPARSLLVLGVKAAGSHRESVCIWPHLVTDKPKPQWNRRHLPCMIVSRGFVGTEKSRRLLPDHGTVCPQLSKTMTHKHNRMCRVSGGSGAQLGVDRIARTKAPLTSPACYGAPDCLVPLPYHWHGPQLICHNMIGVMIWHCQVE